MANARFANLGPKIIRTLHLWTRSKWLPVFQWQSFSSYWKLRRWWNVSWFKFAGRLFNTRTYLKSGTESGLLIAQLARSVAIKLAFAICLVALLEVAARLGDALGSSLSEHFLIRTRFPFLMGFFAHLRPDSNAYTSLLATLASVSGVFLGLYFTAVSALTAGVYSRVPADIRSLLIADKISNVYIQVVAYLGVFSIVLLVLETAGWTATNLTVFFLGIIAVVSLFSFIVLGTRTFYFYDPPALARYALQELYQSMMLATSGGLHWRQPSFQSHHQRNAEHFLDSFAGIVRLSTTDQYQHLRGDSIASMAARALRLEQSYCHLKLQIPTKSLWFRQEIKQTNWLMAGHSQVQIALQTSTSVRPKEVNDYHWIDRLLSNSIRELLKCLLDRQQAVDAAGTATKIVDSLGHMAELWFIDDAFYLRDQLALAIATITSETDIDLSTGANIDRIRLALAVIDADATALIEIILGAGRHLSRFDADVFYNQIAGVNWTQDKAIYSKRMPQPVLFEMEELAEKIRFEKESEGIVRTPVWYSAQICALGMTKSVLARIRAIIGRLQKDFVVSVESFVKKNKTIFAAQTIIRGLEACAKAERLIQQTKSFMERASILRRIKDIPWPSYDSTADGQTIAQTRQRLIAFLVQISGFLQKLPPTDQIPDYFGQIYSILAENCYREMAKGNADVLRSLFPAVLQLATSAPDRVLSSLEEYPAQARMMASMEPILDLLDLSGYARIYSEFLGKELWEIVTQTWDSYLARVENPSKACAYLAGVANFKGTQFYMTPRGLLRTQWEIDLLRSLREKGLVAEYEFPPNASSTSRLSPVLRSVAMGDFVAHRANEFFDVFYLFKRPELAKTPMPQRSRELATILDRQQRNVDEELEEA